MSGFAHGAWLAAALVLSIGVVSGWGVVRLRQAKAAVTRALASAGLRSLAMRRRIWRTGPFDRDPRAAQIVYRVVVRDPSGAERVVWAQWGRAWFLARDRLELRSDAGDRIGGGAGGERLG